MHTEPTGGVSRREILGTGAATASMLAAPAMAAVTPDKAREADPPLVRVMLTVNGKPENLTLDARTTLLDMAREHLKLTGSKKGCDHGQCGACTMIVEGRRVNSCLSLAVMHDGDTITTIEGLGTPDKLHPMQAAFVRHDGYQCGYCTPGQIVSAVAMLEEVRSGAPSFVSPDLEHAEYSDTEVRERMSGNLCRCAAYPNIVAAIGDVHAGKKS
ncbi:aldehyde dehydrogenase iron-sulfur subunit PaoA [Sphingomonas prati]|uniref:Xanthine dehydrogenase YagT iron-sulfur-binding subunit n=1 Tax=Sphingomonas prati TaxID=1843237 RepID=A0A7W9F428_9SPHN|nr:aldehyde dehydrogenase iron-sulfur subunit PaoA [Sphingomonas prati]MBB5730459.1 xanthine dehydrogenase YagT iron-sulfur-binding subunit [Sphingomonas prati]GGE94218.1 aldehyde oxidoreductase [Sphingomonas prati]